MKPTWLTEYMAHWAEYSAWLHETPNEHYGRLATAGGYPGVVPTADGFFLWLTEVKYPEEPEDVETE